MHKHNSAKNTGEGGKSTMGIRNFNLPRSQVRKRGKIGLNQSLKYIHTHLSLTLLPNFFYLHLLKSVAKIIPYAAKILEGHLPILVPYIMPKGI
jgi:hypothetical protein